MVVLSFACLLFSAAVYASDWQTKYDWGSQGGLMLCEGDKWMNGVCATSSRRHCSHHGHHKSNMLKCGRFEGTSQASVRFVIGEWSEMIHCPTGTAAVSACSSGQNNDCQCTGGSGCSDKDDWHPHHLQCAEGLDLVDTDTTEVSSRYTGEHLHCPRGYVVYGFCASRIHDACRDKYNKKRSSVIKCVKVMTDDDFSDDALITKATGFWNHLGSFNAVFKRGITVGVENAKSTTEATTESKKFGFSQELTVGVTYTSGGLGGSAEASVGFSQEFEKSVHREISTTVREWEENDIELNCGNGDAEEFESIWQWYWTTEAKSGADGPVIKTDTYFCSSGGKNSLTRPRCPPELSVDPMFTVCTYDYCDITSVDGDDFHFDKECVDRKLDRDDWGADAEELEGVEHHHAEHVRNGEVIEFGTVVLRRDGCIRYTDDEGSWLAGACGSWANNRTGSWEAGDTFRVLAEWENPTSAALMPASFFAVLITVAAYVAL